MATLATIHSPLSFLLPQALSLPSPAGAIGSNGSSRGTTQPAAERLRCRPAGPVADDLTFGGKGSCVDSSLASLGAFLGARNSWGVGSLLSRSPSPPSPDVPAILGAWSGGIDAPEERSHTPLTLARYSRLHHSRTTLPRICHPSSVIRHLPSGICHLPFLLPHSPFRIPHFLAEGATHFLVADATGAIRTVDAWPAWGL